MWRSFLKRKKNISEVLHKTHFQNELKHYIYISVKKKKKGKFNKGKLNLEGFEKEYTLKYLATACHQNSNRVFMTPSLSLSWRMCYTYQHPDKEIFLPLNYKLTPFSLSLEFRFCGSAIPCQNQTWCYLTGLHYLASPNSSRPSALRWAFLKVPSIRSVTL